MELEKLQRLHDQVTEVLALSLRVVDLVAAVDVAGLEQVEDGQDLAVVRHKSLADGVRAHDKCLQHVQSCRNDFGVTSVQGR